MENKKVKNTNVNTWAMERAIKDVSSDKESVKYCYGMDDVAYEFWKTAKLNTDIIWKNDPEKAEIGYKAYWNLENYVKENNMEEDVLYDLAADFCWGGGLADACERFDAELK